MKFQEEPKFEKGKVLETKNDFVTVEVKRSFECEGCNLESFCMKGNEDKTQFEIANTLEAKKNDLVTFELNPRSRVLSSFLIFIMPLIILCMIYFITKNLLSFSENIAIVLSIAAWGLSFFLLKYFNSVLGKSNFFKPKLIEIISE